MLWRGGQRTLGDGCLDEGGTGFGGSQDGVRQWVSCQT